MLYRNTPDLAQRFKNDGIRYGVSVGRRQPMHRVHLDCLREIIAHDLKLICVHGSVNPKGSRFYNPEENPLTLPELEEQVRRALPGVEVIHLAIADRGDAALWSRDLAGLLGDKLSASVMHYRRKREDKREATIRPLSETQALLMEQGLAIWESENAAATDYAVHGRDLRMMDIHHLTSAQEALFADAGYIKELCGNAPSLHELGVKRR